MCLASAAPASLGTVPPWGGGAGVVSQGQRKGLVRMDVALYSEGSCPHVRRSEPCPDQTFGTRGGGGQRWPTVIS